MENLHQILRMTNSASTLSLTLTKEHKTLKHFRGGLTQPPLSWGYFIHPIPFDSVDGKLSCDSVFENGLDRHWLVNFERIPFWPDMSKKPFSTVGYIFFYQVDN